MLFKHNGISFPQNTVQSGSKTQKSARNSLSVRIFVFFAVKLLVIFNILNNIADGLDVLNSLVGDLDIEFFLKAHN